MRRSGRWIAVLAIVLLGASTAWVYSDDQGAEQQAGLEQAREQFQRHNYRAALEIVDRYIELQPLGVELNQARLIRGQCLLKLRQWEAGVDELQRLLAANPDLAARPDLHEALGEVGLQQHQYKHLTIEHFGIAADLYLAVGDKQAAAAALINKAQGFVGFDAWQRLTRIRVEQPDDWRAQRRLQQQYAVAALDRAIELAGDSELAAEAIMRKARLYERDLRVDAGDIDVALATYAQVVERWPSSPRAAEALYQIGQLQESYKQDFVAAVKLFQRVMDEHRGTHWADRAAGRVRQITEPVLQLSVEGPVLPGKPGEIHFRCRNVKSLSLQAYPVDLFDLVRQIGYLPRLNEWRPGGEPATTWDVAVPDHGQHKQFDSHSEDLNPTALPVRDAGAYVIVAQDEGRRVRATTMMIVSRLACLTKGGRSATLLVAADAESGQPAAGADVLVQRHLGKDRFQYTTGTTDDAGHYRAFHADGKDRGGAEKLFLRDGQHYAVCNSSFHWYWWGYGEPYLSYTFTERPVYRPDQLIHFKAVLRHYDQGTYENAPGKPVSLQVYDPRGEVIDKLDLLTNDEGSISGDLRLPDGAALGVYRIQLEVGGRQVADSNGARFRVEEYRKPEFEVTVTADRPVYRVGDTVGARIEARYYFGEPVVGAQVACTVHRARHYPMLCPPLPWPWFYDDVLPGFAMPRDGKRILYPGPYPRPEMQDLVGTYAVTTDEEGVAVLRIETEPLEADPDADLRYDIQAEVTDQSRRVITGSGQVKVTHKPFYVHVEPQRYVYQPGDTVRLDVTAKGPNDDPVTFRGTCKVYRLERNETADASDASADANRIGEKVFERAVDVDQGGQGAVRWIADEEGPFRVVVVAPAGPQEEVTASCDVWIAQRGGRYKHYAYRDVELVMDRTSSAVGNTARVLINTRFDSCYVLLAAEADDLLDERTVFVKGGTKLVELPITPAHVPNFALTASVLRDNRIYQDQVPVVVPPVDRFLNVEIDAGGEKFYPRQPLTLGLRTTDSTGAPAPAEVALMMVDASIYYIQPEFREQIEKHFYGSKRPHLVRTQTSFDYYGVGRGEARIRMDSATGVAMLEGAAAPSQSMRAMGAMAERKDAGADFATPQIRKEFPDTVVWAAHVKTDEAGRASVKAELPDTLTTWRIHAVAVDRDTRVGQAAADVVTHKDVIARLEAPRFLVEGDEPVLSVIAHNYLPEEKTIRVTLEASDEIEIGSARVHGLPADGSSPGQADVTIPADGEVAVEFPARALSAGQAKLLATAAADVDADAVEIKLPILTYGADRFVAHSGSIRQGDANNLRTVSLTVPQEVAPDSPLLEVHLNPSIASVMIDALPFLLQYPYGCTEQTMSRFLPAVVTRRTLQELGIDLAAVRRKIEAQGGPLGGKFPERFRENPVFNNAVMDDMIRAGLERLADLQRPDGGWGWWGGGDSNPYMTAYVVYGLAEAVKADVAFDHGMLERGVSYLLKRVVSTEAVGRRPWHGDDDNVRAWMVYALAMHDPNLLARDEIRSVCDRIYKGRDGLTDYSRALLMIALHRAGDSQRVAILVENLYNTVRLDADTDTASWGQSHQYRYWYDNGLETTAMVLRALLMTQPEHEYVARSVNWLVRNRRGARWFSTKDTAFAVYALADYLVASGELQADMTVGLTIDGQIQRSFKITPENALTFDARVIVSPENLAPGEHRVELTRSGKGNVYYGVYLDYFTHEDPIEPAGNEAYVTRSYVRLVPREVTGTRQVYDPIKRKTIEETYRAIEYDALEVKEGDRLSAGDLIEVRLAVEARNNLEYLIIEDPKAAGCEPVELRSGSRWGEGPFVNVELRDTRTAFFATYLSQGEHQLSYRLRCETPGRFHALPARVEAMYAPLVRSNSRSDKLQIDVGR